MKTIVTYLEEIMVLQATIVKQITEDKVLNNITIKEADRCELEHPSPSKRRYQHHATTGETNNVYIHQFSNINVQNSAIYST